MSTRNKASFSFISFVHRVRFLRFQHALFACEVWARHVAVVKCGQAHAVAGHRVLRIPSRTFHTCKGPRLQPFRSLLPWVAASAVVARATVSLKLAGSPVSHLPGAAAGVALVPVNVSN